MMSAAQAKKHANAHLQAASSPYVASRATRDKKFDVWVVSYMDPARPDGLLMGGALVVTDDGMVHDQGSAPGSLEMLMSSLGRFPALDGHVPRTEEPLPWPTLLGEETRKPYFTSLLDFVQRERDTPAAIFPDEGKVFEAFRLTSPGEVKVVLLGQDPYPRRGHANGLCFSVPRDLQGRLPASLLNIHVAMRGDGIMPPDHGDLSPWAKQGVLLLNTALTVREGQPKSHADKWATFTNAVIHHLVEGERPLVFVLWGRAAQRHRRLIEGPAVHKIIEAPHPASRGKSQQAFRAEHTFSRVNDALGKLGHDPIRWGADTVG